MMNKIGRIGKPSPGPLAGPIDHDWLADPDEAARGYDPIARLRRRLFLHQLGLDVVIETSSRPPDDSAAFHQGVPYSIQKSFRLIFAVVRNTDPHIATRGDPSMAGVGPLTLKVTSPLVTPRIGQIAGQFEMVPGQRAQSASIVKRHRCRMVSRHQGNQRCASARRAEVSRCGR